MNASDGRFLPKPVIFGSRAAEEGIAMRKDRVVVGFVIGVWLTAHLVFRFGPKLEYASGMVIGVLIGYLCEPFVKYVELTVQRSIVTLKILYLLWKRESAFLSTLAIHALVNLVCAFP